MILSFLLVYFGIRSYRDNVGNGRISFGKAFIIGISITFISSLCYVVTWEILYFKFLPDFMDKLTPAHREAASFRRQRRCHSGES